MKECGCKHHAQQMPMPCPYYPMSPMPMTPTPAATMPATPTPSATMPEQLETMYPKTYNIIYPKVYQHCDMMEKKYGSMHCPTHEHMKSMVESICCYVEKEVEESIKGETKEQEARQLGFHGRFLLRDLASILLIRELLRRRMAYGYPMYGYPGYGYGYPMYGYGYPGYGYGYPMYGY